MSNTNSSSVVEQADQQSPQQAHEHWSELQYRMAEERRQVEMLAAFTHLQSKFAKKPTRILKQEYVAVLTDHGYKAQWVWTASKTEIIRSWAVFAVEVK